MKIRKFSICLLVACLLLTAGCSQTAKTREQAGEPVFVAARQAVKTAMDQEITASANIEGHKTVKLGFLVAGKINYIAVAEGSMLQAGQLLASLDPESYRIAREMADANCDQAQDEYNRLSIMHERKSLSESDFSRITNTLRLARAQQKLQTKNLADTKLYCPIRGVLLKRGVEVGEIIGAGMPLFGVADISTVIVNASVPETDLHLVRPGVAATVYVASIDSTFTGRVVEIGSVAEPTTRSFTVRIELDNPGLLIRPGMTAEIKMVSGRKIDRILVPGEAVLRDPADNTSCVFIVDPASQKAFKRKIALGSIAGNLLEVTSGISPGEWVVIGGQHKLNDGSPVVMKQAL